MNNSRRSRLTSCASSLSSLHSSVETIKDMINMLSNLKEHFDWWSSNVDKIEAAIDKVEQEEQTALDSIPDNLQYGDIASSIDNSLSLIWSAQRNIASLKDAIDSVEDSYITSFLSSFDPDELIDKLDGLIEEIDEAKDAVEEAKS